MVVHTPFPATLARVKNMSSILYTPIKRSITASGSPTELNIMFKLKMPAIATEGVLRVVKKIMSDNVTSMDRPKSIPWA